MGLQQPNERGYSSEHQTGNERILPAVPHQRLPWLGICSVLRPLLDRSRHQYPHDPEDYRGSYSSADKAADAVDYTSVK